MNYWWYRASGFSENENIKRTITETLGKKILPEIILAATIFRMYRDSDGSFVPQYDQAE
jgi:hypothetical protein